MKTKIYFCMLIIVLSIVSCSEKEKPEIIFPKIPFWKLVQGTYKVTNEVNNEEFEMKISIKTDTIWLSNNQYINNDSIFLYNFNNSFDSVTSRYASCITSESNNCINFNASYGIKDKFGNRWLLDNYDDPSTQ